MPSVQRKTAGPERASFLAHNFGGVDCNPFQHAIIHERIESERRHKRDMDEAANGGERRPAKRLRKKETEDLDNWENMIPEILSEN